MSTVDVIRAAGAVLWRRSDAGVEVAVVHRPRYDDWSLPKGKLDAPETIPAAAAREVTEETGYSCVLEHPLMEVSYAVKSDDGTKRPKTVQYFSARATDGEFAPNDEVDRLEWLPLSDARTTVSHEGDAAVLDRFSQLGRELTTVVLVRHAKAGRRADWDGDDDLRPLSEAGWRQAEALHELLPLFGPDSVYSAPRLRCVQTVRAVAEDLDLEIKHEPKLTETAYSDDPDGSIDRFLELVTAGGTPVVCSQGGVVPGLVTTLAERADLPLPGVGAKKGSVWLLSFSGSRLVAAYYLPSALGEND